MADRVRGLAAAATPVIVFALQHTQARQQPTLQRKLEILRVLPGALPASCTSRRLQKASSARHLAARTAGSRG